ncbi:MAG TPA: hypothetical protein VMA37_07160 [Acetobacteraceae bacterium]|nr:hypothetical protein [Acetobacteraceae bacterium]
MHGEGMRGHNRPARTAQWQTPHLSPEERRGAEAEPAQDLDLIAASFAEGFSRCSDPTSFLRLAGVPFTGRDGAGRQLNLLRVELQDLTDVGSVVPLLGGQGTRYAPLPGRLASRRRQVRFVYHDGRELVSLDFVAARALEHDES